MNPACFHFGPFRLDPHNRRLWRDEQAVELSARYLDVLILLAGEGGGLVTKDRFMDEVWRGIPVTDEALTQAIRTLRRALGDDAAAPQYIETVPKHGYRFIAAVQPGTVPVAPVVDAPGFSRSAFIRAILGGTAGAAVAGALIGVVYGVLGAAQPDAAGGALSLVLVLVLVTLFSATIAGCGIAAGIAASRFIPQPHGYWSVAGGALGGLVTGAMANLVGSDAFQLLFGRTVGQFAGTVEGVIAGAAVGLAVTFGDRVRYPVALGAALGLLAGVAVAVLDGRLMAGSLQELLSAFPGSRFRLDGVGQALGERGLGPTGRFVTAAFEGAVFCACMVWGLRRVR